MDDQLSDFNPETGHMRICVREDGEPVACNRDCSRRLYDVAVRLERLLNPTEVGDLPGVDGPLCGALRRGQPCVLDPGHVEAGQTQHEDQEGNRWPTHQPWSPEYGYGPPEAVQSVSTVRQGGQIQ